MATLQEALALYSRARMFDKKASADLCADKLIKHNPNDWPAEGVDRLTKEDLLLLVRALLPRLSHRNSKMRSLTLMPLPCARQFKRYATY